MVPCPSSETRGALIGRKLHRHFKYHTMSTRISQQFLALAQPRRAGVAAATCLMALFSAQDCQAQPEVMPWGNLRGIYVEGERLNFLIGDLLTLSLLEGGGDILAKTPFSLCELVKEVTADADFEAASLNRQVTMETCTPTELTGNRELLRRALENIVRNAVRYTKESTCVEISLGRNPAGHALLRVRDHGPGVPDSALTNIFRPFYRVASDRDRHSGGAGIGLAIAERTVRLSGGTILARNVPGGGLEIEMALPLT